MATREQKYAESAYNLISEIGKNGDAYHQKYGSLAHKLPILVRQAGLAQALAFAATRKPAAQQKLLEHIARTVLDSDMDTLLHQSRALPLMQYMHLTDDVMLALTWYKRYAQSVLGIDPTTEDEEIGQDEE